MSATNLALTSATPPDPTQEARLRMVSTAQHNVEPPRYWLVRIDEGAIFTTNPYDTPEQLVTAIRAALEFAQLRNKIGRAHV